MKYSKTILLNAIVSGLFVSVGANANTMGYLNTATLLRGTVEHRLMPTGVAAGDTFKGSGLWVEGLYNHAKQKKTSSNEGFKANTRGVAVGLDGKLSEAMTVGFGYGYTNTSADAGVRDIDVDGHSVFLYGQYQPDAWYANWLLGYSYNKYKETAVGVRAKYHTNTYAADFRSGYRFSMGLAPEWGFRYIHADRESYTAGAGRVKSNTNKLFTAIVGLNYIKAITTDNVVFVPHLNVDAIYDLKTDRTEANVHLIGGRDYQISGKRQRRFGMEAGAGLTMTMGAFDLSMDYHGEYRRDFQSHTGLLRAKYNF